MYGGICFLIILFWALIGSYGYAVDDLKISKVLLPKNNKLEKVRRIDTLLQYSNSFWKHSRTGKIILRHSKRNVGGVVKNIPKSLFTNYQQPILHEVGSQQVLSLISDHDGSKNLLVPEKLSGSEKIHEVSMYLIIYVLPFVTCIGIIGNVFTIIVFFNSFLTKVPCWSYLAALSISDFGFLSTTMIIIISSSSSTSSNYHEIQLGAADTTSDGSTADYIIETSRSLKPPSLVTSLFHKNGMCQILTYLHEVFGTLSVWIIVMFTVERFLVICKPWKKDSRIIFLTQIKSISLARANKVIVTLVILTATWFSYTFKTQKIVSSSSSITIAAGQLLSYGDGDFNKNLKTYLRQPNINNTTSYNYNYQPSKITYGCDIDPHYERTSYILKNIETTVMLIVPLLVILTCNVLIARKLISYRTIWKRINLKNASIKDYRHPNPLLFKSKFLVNLSSRQQQSISSACRRKKNLRQKKKMGAGGHSGSIKPLIRQESTITNTIKSCNSTKKTVETFSMSKGKLSFITAMYRRRQSSIPSMFAILYDQNQQQQLTTTKNGVCGLATSHQPKYTYDLVKKLSTDTDDLFSEDNNNNNLMQQQPTIYTTSTTSPEQHPQRHQLSSINSKYLMGRRTKGISGNYKSFRFVKFMSSFSSSCSLRNSSNKSNTTNTTVTTTSSAGKDTQHMLIKSSAIDPDMTELSGKDVSAHDKRREFIQKYTFSRNKKRQYRRMIGKSHSTGNANVAASCLAHSASNPGSAAINAAGTAALRNSGSSATVGGIIDSRGKNSKSQMAVTKMLLIVSTIFLFVHTPFHASRFALFIFSLRSGGGDNMYSKSLSSSSNMLKGDFGDSTRKLPNNSYSSNLLIQIWNASSSLILPSPTKAGFSQHNLEPQHENYDDDLFDTGTAWITFPYFLRHISYAVNVFLYSASGTNFRKAVIQVRRKFKIILLRLLGKHQQQLLSNNYGQSYVTKGGSLFSTYEPPSFVKSYYHPWYTTTCGGGGPTVTGGGGGFEYGGSVTSTVNYKYCSHTNNNSITTVLHPTNNNNINTNRMLVRLLSGKNTLNIGKSLTITTEAVEKNLPNVKESQSEYIIVGSDGNSCCTPDNIASLEEDEKGNLSSCSSENDEIKYPKDSPKKKVDPDGDEGVLKNYYFPDSGGLPNGNILSLIDSNITSPIVILSDENYKLPHVVSQTRISVDEEDVDTVKDNKVSIAQSRHANTIFKYRLKRFPNNKYVRCIVNDAKLNYNENLTRRQQNRDIPKRFPTQTKKVGDEKEPKKFRRCSMFIRLVNGLTDNSNFDGHNHKNRKISLSPNYTKELLAPWSADPTVISETPSSQTQMREEPSAVRSDNYLLSRTCSDQKNYL